jgi:polysaccharide biosynthesis protein PslG
VQIRPLAARRYAILAFLAVAILSLGSSSAAAGATGWVRLAVQRPHSHAAAQRSESGIQSGRKTQPPKGSGAAPVGFSVGGGFQNESSSDVRRDFDSMQTAGARWVRMDVNWAVIQAQGPSAYNWAPFDRVASDALAHGLSVLAVVEYTPAWARPAGTPAETPPTNLDDYARFAQTAAAHYAALGVHAFEIWNEPNISAFWRPKPDVARYTRMLTLASTAIRAVDPQAVIVTGGTAPAADDGTNIAPVTFLRGIYANGGKSSFAAVGHHPYCWPAQPGEPYAWSAWYVMYGTSPSLRSTMVANGDGAKKIWATEFGAPTNGPAGTFVSEDAQSRMVGTGISLFRSYDWAGPLFWYSGRDLGTSTSTRENFFGLLRYDYSQKPAFAAFKAAATGS